MTWGATSEAREQRDDGRLDAEHARPRPTRSAPTAAPVIRDPGARPADDEQSGAARGRGGGAMGPMRDENHLVASRGSRPRRRAEAARELDPRNDGVDGLLESEQELLSQRRGRESRALPVALLDARAREEHEALHAQRRRLLQHLAQARRARERERERDRKRGRGLAFEHDLELERALVERDDRSSTEPAVDPSDRELVAGLRAQDLLRVPVAAIRDAHAPRGDLVVLVVEQNVQRARV